MPSKKKAPKKAPPPIQEWLALAGHEIDSFAKVIDAAEWVSPRPDDGAEATEKKNYAQRLSDAMAVLVANKLRGKFPGILPTERGKGAESRVRTGKGVKKLDVNYSTVQLGLGLGISIKSINFRDPKSGRYTKNPTARDNELRAEAMDHHERQPFSVLACLFLVPRDACRDGNEARKKQSRSSFAQMVKVLRHRTGREDHDDDPQHFEQMFIGLYDYGEEPDVSFFDVQFRPVPQFGAPEKGLLALDDVLARIVAVYDERNLVKPPWEEKEPTEAMTLDELAATEHLAPPESDGEPEDL